jgi:monovalent cation:proton antiporter-2 (CPA2) family protein
MGDHSFLNSVFLYLLAAVVAVPLFKRMGLGSVLGYLAAGMVIGPFGFALIKDVNAILSFSEFGVVLLMFLIGLELNPSKLWQMHRQIFGFGVAQVLGSFVLLVCALLMFGLSGGVAGFAALALALSSTPIALQTLKERRLANADIGKMSFSVLLFQDISIIPILAMIPIFADMSGSSSFDFMMELKLVGVFGFFLLASRYLIKPLLRVIALTDLREVFTSFALLLVVGSGLLMEMVGISMALGTFLAGVLLADSEYRHELELNIEPFKGLLMGLFFIAVGMSVDLSLFMAQPLRILMLVSGLFVIKSIVLIIIARFAGFTSKDQILFAILISPAGEFAFVLLSLLTAASLLPSDIAAILLVVASFSMLVSPLLLFLYDLSQKRQVTPENRKTDVEANTDHVVVAGFGRFGQIVARLMMSLKIPVTVVDNNPNHIESLRKFGYPVFYGDATRLDLLEAAGLKEARLLVLAMDDASAITETAKLVKSHFPKLTILARARSRSEVVELREAGVRHVRREMFSSSLELGEMALRELGYPAHLAHRVVGRFRRYDEYAIEVAAQYRGDEAAVIDFSKKSRAQLEDLMARDSKLIIDDDKW